VSRSLGAGLALAGPAVAFTAILGGRFTALGIGPWYDGLAKPGWTPPGSVIGAVWTVLYVLIACASALVWSKAGPAPLAYAGVLLVNLALNAFWCYLFFAARRPGAAFAEIGLLWLTCLALVVLAARRSTAGAWMLVPYAAWVAFAGFLNWNVVKLNP
jgi:tryptophan-rich sensory protein